MSIPMVRVGDVVTYRANFGMDVPTRAKVTGLTITKAPRDKYGDEVQAAPWALVEQNRVLFSFGEIQRWAYSSQVEIPPMRAAGGAR